MRTHRYITVGLIVLVLFILIGGILYSASPHVKADSDWIKYHFDVKLLRLNTTIDVYKDNEQIGTVKGKVVRFVTDPLTYYNIHGNKIAYADDTYHVIKQDSHLIVCDGVVTAEMAGKYSFLGNAYDIYDAKGTRIADAYFDAFNLKGRLTNAEGIDVASYSANIITKDFDVYVSPENTIDEDTLIMIFCSYYSDQAADEDDSSSNDD